MMEDQRPLGGVGGGLKDNSISSGEWLLLRICETGEEKMPHSATFQVKKAKHGLYLNL